MEKIYSIKDIGSRYIIINETIRLGLIDKMILLLNHWKDIDYSILVMCCIYSDQLECMKYLCENGAPKRKIYSSICLSQNRLECLKYLVDNNFPLKSNQ